MRFFIYLGVLFIISSCGSDNPIICDSGSEITKAKLEVYSSDCGNNLTLNDSEEINFLKKEICNCKSKFILNSQGDLWYVRIYFDLNEKEYISLTKTVAGTYYFRDKDGTYSNDILAKKIVDWTGVECE